VNEVEQIFRLLERRGQSSHFGERCPNSNTLFSALTSRPKKAQATNWSPLPRCTTWVTCCTRVERISGIKASIPCTKSSGRHGSRDISVSRLPRPIALHVAAKRYLCATDNSYAARLSPACLQSLQLEGGPMNVEEIAKFESDEFAKDAVCLRRWDDLAKIK
jgi:hypothetical protein